VRILETTTGEARVKQACSKTGMQARTHASKEATLAIQGHPLAPAAWHGTMERSLVLVLCMVQRDGAISGKRGVQRLLLVQNPRSDMYTALYLSIETVQNLRSTV